MITLQLQVVGIISTRMLLVELNHNLDLDLMLILPLYRVPVGWGLRVKAQLKAQSLPWLILWFFSGVMKREAQSFLGYSFILKSKHCEDKVTMGCFTLHSLLHMQTCKHRASTKTGPSPARAQIQRAWVWHFMTWAFFSTRENSGRRENEQYATLPASADQRTYLICKQIQTEKQERKESEISFSQ